jgi:hypothetical protein
MALCSVFISWILLYVVSCPWPEGLTYLSCAILAQGWLDRSGQVCFPSPRWVALLGTVFNLLLYVVSCPWPEGLTYLFELCNTGTRVIGLIMCGLTGGVRLQLWAQGLLDTSQMRVIGQVGLCVCVGMEVSPWLCVVWLVLSTSATVGLGFRVFLLQDTPLPMAVGQVRLGLWGVVSLFLIMCVLASAVQLQLWVQDGLPYWASVPHLPRAVWF